MKEKNVLIIIGIIILALVLSNYNLDFKIVTPSTPDNSLQKSVNLLYFPVATRSTNSEKCIAPEVQIGSTFDPNTQSLKSGDTIFIEGKYYKYKGTSTARKDCVTAYGSQITVSNSVPFANFILFKKTDNQYYLCQNTNTGNRYWIFEYSKTAVSLRYTTPKTEQQGKYYCDGKSIYLLPCANGKRVLMETCALGCEKTKSLLDSQNIDVVKCKGEYKPNIQICSVEGDKLFKTDSKGILSSQDCCCKNNACAASSNCAPKSKCELVSGDGNGQVNIFVYGGNENEMKNWAKWIYTELPSESPYNEFSYNVYYEANQYDCNSLGIRRSTKDFDAGWASWFTAIGMSNWGDTNHIWFNPVRGRAGFFPNDHFLLFHELGHCYTSGGHTNDGSIMDYRLGGDGKYRDYQRVSIRSKLSTGISNTIFPVGYGWQEW